MESAFRRFTFLLCLLVLGTTAWAQTTTGSITGLVTDPSGAVVAGANVSVIDPTTGKDYATVTGADGSFTVTALPVGFYRVKVGAKGFSDAIMDNVQVNLGQASKVNAKLAMGTVGTEVVVTGEQQNVQTDSVTISSSIDRRQIMNLPLNTRNPLDLVKSMAGTASIGSDVFVHGLRAQTVNLMQDGVNISDNYVKTSGFFSLLGSTVDSVSEFTVTSSAAGTDSGFGSTQVNMVTSSGTNALHGSVYWYQRTSYLNANPYFNGVNGQKTPFQLQNRVGYQIGGPVVIPKIYNGKNKTFFFNNFEVFRQPAQQNTNRLILADAARTGVYTYTRADSGAQNTVNLLTMGTLGNSTATPVINSQVMGYYNSIVPSANNDTCGGADGINLRCFTWNVPGSAKSNRYVGRLDQNIGDHHTASFVLNMLRTRNESDFLNQDFPFFPKSLGAGQGGIRELFSWSLRSTIGTTVTNLATFGIQRSPVDFFIHDDYSATGGFQVRPATATVANGLSDVSFMSTNLPQGRNTPVWEASDSATWIHGRHSMTFGGDYRQVKASNYFYNAVQPNVNLGNNPSNPDNLTAAKVPGGISQTGLTNAQTVFDTVTGLIGSTVQGFNHTSPTSGFVPGKPRFLDPVQHNFAVFAQDNWRVRPNLTLIGGLRWEFQGVFDLKSGLILQPDPGQRAQAVFGPSAVGSLFAPSATPAVSDITVGFGGGNNGKPLYNRDWNNFAPTFGFAWDPFKDGKTAVRGAFSSHYTTDGFTLFATAATTNSGLFSTVTNGSTTGVFNSASVPLPKTPADIIPVSLKNNFGQGTGVNVNLPLVSFSQNLPVPYVLEWNFAIQHEFAKHLTVEARYVGNHGVKLYRTTNYNELNLLNNPYSAGGASVANVLTEFKNAASNLAICTANKVACGGTLTFANKNLPGQVALPILQTLFTGFLPTSTSGFASSTFQTNLTQGQVYTMFNTLRTDKLYFTNRTTNFPLNFFVANPWVTTSSLVDNSSWSNYNGLELEVRRRFSSGLSFQGNYTFSKVETDQRFLPNAAQNDAQQYISLANRALDRGVAPWNITHNVSGNFLYSLPFGRGKKFANGVSRWVDAVIGGYDVQGLINVSSGQRLSMLSARLTTGAGAGIAANAILRNMSKADFQKQLGVFKVPGAVFYINPSSGLFTYTTKTSTSGIPIVSSNAVMCTAGQTTPCWDHPPAGSYGNMPYYDFIGPAFWNSDASIIKRIYFSENQKRNLEFRLEAFNVMNHANFALPSATQVPTVASTGNNITSTQFGQTLGVVDTGRGGGVNARLVQWAMRINF